VLAEVIALLSDRKNREDKNKKPEAEDAVSAATKLAIIDLITAGPHPKRAEHGEDQEDNSKSIPEIRNVAATAIFRHFSSKITKIC